MTLSLTRRVVRSHANVACQNPIRKSIIVYHSTGYRARVGSSVLYREGKSSDRWPIFKLLLAEKMNPLGILVPMEENFVVAFDSETMSLLGAGQMKPLHDDCYELSSCVVDKEFRGQGIGTRIVNHLLDQAPRGAEIYLVTVEDREDFYEKRCGFRRVQEDIPPELTLEVLIGTCVAKAVTGRGLIIMRCDTTLQ